jgi:hypothetical protein
MQMRNEELETDLNNEVHLLSGEAEALFAELGILDKFHRQVSDEVAKQVLFYTQHLTHWIIAIRNTGNFGSQKNEFEAICFPKMKVPLLTFQRLAAKLLDPPQEPVVRGDNALPKPTETGCETLPLL